MADVTIRELTKKFGESRALAGVSVDLPAGRITAILGPSGCGKTTLLRILAGLEEADAGTVRMGDAVLSDPRPRVPVERRGIGMVFQDSLLWPHLTVRANIGFPLGAGRGDDPRVERAANRTEVAEFLDRWPSGLSGGEQRRVAIARAIVAEPDLLLMDEPLSGLDANLRVRLLLAIRGIQRELGVTAGYVTHDQEEALGVADRIVVMRNGRVLQAGTPEEIYARPATEFVAGFVGLSSVVSGEGAGQTVRTALGEFPVADAADGAVRLAIRPESVRVGSGGPAKATVTKAAYRGDRWLVTLESGGEELLAWSDVGRGPGDEVTFRIDPAPVVVAADEENE
ncbi:MAG: ABC transporter ATP-binding protein [Planctomycetota bacterium]